MHPSIPHNSPWITSADVNAVSKVLESNWLATGPKTNELENVFANYMGEGQAVAVSSGSAALFLALNALKIGQGHKVALPTYACSALLNAVYMSRAEPILFDCKEDNFTICTDSLTNYSGKLDVIIAVHTYGAYADITPLKKLNISIIEDCCQSLGSHVGTEPIGIESDCSVFSFYATKNITGGYGGLVWSKTQHITNTIRNYINFDCCERYIPRFNFSIGDMQSALILSQLQRLETIRDRRIHIANCYDEALPSCLSKQIFPNKNSEMPYRYVVKAKNEKQIEKLKSHMQTLNINCIIPLETYELLHRYLGKDPNMFPNAEHIAKTTLSLPLFPKLTDNEIARVCNALKTFRL